MPEPRGCAAHGDEDDPRVPREVPGRRPEERPLPEGPREVPPGERDPHVDRPPVEAPGKPGAPLEAPPPNEAPAKEPEEPTPVVVG